ncbi:hypothetical protein [Candidatus Uabimicrobium sp. HlEnr_7]|uniref:thioesterase domain-containing protein n=1 Tax=Candidatus Uabimicrobium helgolandensis TaxID=3095367 RepID=UPI003557F47D
MLSKTKGLLKENWKNYRNVYNANYDAMERFIPTAKVTVPVYYFQAQEECQERDYVARYQKYSTPQITVIPISCNHINMMKSPSVEIIAKKLQCYLANEENLQ